MGDQTNPYLMMGMMQMMEPNRFLDPAYANSPLPLPGYYGTPTDAMGRPIQSFLDAQKAHDAWNASQGTTLNSTPPAASSQVMDPNQFGGATANWINQAPNLSPQQKAATWQRSMPQGQQPVFGSGGGPGGNQQIGWTPSYATPPNFYTPGAGAAASAPAPQNPIDMRQAYLDALSNPGKVTTPGATVPQSNPLGQPSVLDTFLAQNQGGTGAGGYSNQSFFNTLNRLRGGGGAPTNMGGNMGGMNMGSLPGTPPAGTPGAPKDIATRGYLDASGRPTAALTGAMQPWAAAQRQLAGGG